MWYVWYNMSDMIMSDSMMLSAVFLSQISLQLFHYKNENLLFNKDPENFKNSCEKL